VGTAALTEQIFRWAGAHPDKIALDYNGEPWSYRRFAEEIANARGWLSRLGFGGDGLVALALSNKRDIWVIALALRSLGLTTTIVPNGDAGRSLELADFRCVLAAAPAPALQAACAVRAIPMLPASPDGGPPLDRGALSPSRPGGHLLRTSGTTGQYKLVLIDPSFELDYLAARRVANEMDEHSVINVFDFDAWTGVGYKYPAAAWAAGASVVISENRAPHEALLRPGIDHSIVVPALLAGILAQPEGVFPFNERMTLTIAGGTVSWATIEAAGARIAARVMNGLGATESNLIGHTPQSTPEDHRWHRLVQGSNVEIVDDQGRPAPLGEIGELRVEATCAPTGYLGDEEATATVFKDGFFHPGDLAVMRADGRIALMGRVTDVINVAGLKISPAPIEERLGEVLGVSGVCLVSLQDTAGVEGLHAIIETPLPIATHVLAEALRREISAFSGVHVHFVRALPRNEAGKLLRRTVAEQLAAAARG
jgi:acyl-coenzyme A synthetase/AMP-(fatty) acid ligase